MNELNVLDKILREVDARLSFYHIVRSYTGGRLSTTHQTWEVESIDEAVEIYLPIMVRELFDDACECNTFGLEVKYPGGNEFWQEYEDDGGRNWTQIIDEDYSDEESAAIKAESMNQNRRPSKT